jgi:hypothetical protein
MKVPSVNWIPKKTAPCGIGAAVALVSGPRTVSLAESPCCVTTISQWLAAAEMKDSSGSLLVCQAWWIIGERADRSSNVNTSTARFTTAMTGNGSGSHRRWAERSIDHKVTKGVRIPKHMTASSLSARRDSLATRQNWRGIPARSESVVATMRSW